MADSSGGYFPSAHPPEKRDPLANRAHWGAGALMVFAIVVPLAYWMIVYRSGSTPTASAELLPLPQEELTLSPDEERLLALLNEARVKGSAGRPPPLKPNRILVRVAREHAANMAKQHMPADKLDGKDTVARVEEAGYKYFPGRLESNHINSPTLNADEVFRAWMDAPQIKAQMLDGQFTETGIGIARGEDGMGYCYQILAAPQK
jgi:uncharacterized protein YkwD